MSGYLKPGLPQPAPMADGLDGPYWDGLREEKIRLQRCNQCNGWQWGPEWVCHQCLSFNMGFAEVPPVGRIFTWQRVWHPVHPALSEQGPYIVVVVELPGANNVRVVGNLLGDPHQTVVIGAAVEAVFEHHDAAEPPYTLLQWQVLK